MRTDPHPNHPTSPGDTVGMKPLSERDENLGYNREYKKEGVFSRNEATL